MGIEEHTPDAIIANQVQEAWKTLQEKLRSATEAITASYNIIRTKLQLENLEKQTTLMDIKRRENQYLSWIQIFTGALIFNEIFKSILLKEYITPIISIITSTIISIIIYYLTRREQKRSTTQ